MASMHWLAPKKHCTSGIIGPSLQRVAFRSKSVTQGVSAGAVLPLRTSAGDILGWKIYSGDQKVFVGIVEDVSRAQHTAIHKILCFGVLKHTVDNLFSPSALSTRSLVVALKDHYVAEPALQCFLVCR